MSRSAIFDTKQRLREQLINVMLDALEKEGGICLSDQQRNRLFEELNDALMGNVQL